MEDQDTAIVASEAAEVSESATEEHVFTPEEQELLNSQAAEEEAAEPAPAEPAEKSKTQKRFDTLTAQREDERRRADRLEGLLEKALSTQQEKQPIIEPEMVQVPATRLKPTLEGCDYDQELFSEQLTDWKFDQRDAQRTAQEAQRTNAETQQRQEQTFNDKLTATRTAGKKKFPDFDERIDSLPGDVMHRGLAEAIFETSDPADVAYYLSTNPGELAEISRLPPLQMAIALGRVEGKAVVPVPKKKETAAPEPIAQVNAVNATADVEPDPKKDADAWIKWERKRCLALGKRY